MADPINPSITTAAAQPAGVSANTNPLTTSAPAMDTATQGMNPSGSANPTGTSATPAAGDSSSFLSTLSGDISSFFNSPIGALTEFGALAGLGLSEANSQKSTNDQLAASLGSIGQPFTQAGQGTLTQLEGGPAVGGPLGAAITGQTTAAAGLNQAANDAIGRYNSGTLRPTDQQQVDNYVSQQRAMIDSQLAASGNTDSSAKDAAYQQIDNNAALLKQQLLQNDFTTGQQALTQVGTTYNNLLNQALSESQFGFSTQEAAVQTQIASDTQLAASLNSLFGSIAQGFGNALRGSNTNNTSTTGSTAGNLANQAGSALGKLLNGTTAPTGGTSAINPFGDTGTPPANIDIGSTDLSGVTTGQMFGTQLPSSIAGSPPAAIDIGQTDLNQVTPGQMFGTQPPSDTAATNAGFAGDVGTGIAGLGASLGALAPGAAPAGTVTFTAAGDALGAAGADAGAAAAGDAGVAAAGDAAASGAAASGASAAGGAAASGASSGAAAAAGTLGPIAGAMTAAGLVALPFILNSIIPDKTQMPNYDSYALYDSMSWALQQQISKGENAGMAQQALTELTNYYNSHGGDLTGFFPDIKPMPGLGGNVGKPAHAITQD